MSAGRSSTGENERVQAIAALPPPGPTHLEAVNPSKHTPDAPRLSTGTKPSSHSASVCVRAHVLNTHFALAGCAYPAPSACLFPSLCVCVCALGDCVWFLFDSWQQSAGLLCTEPALTQRRQPLSSPVVEPLAPDHQPSRPPLLPPKTFALFVSLFSLDTPPHPPPPSLLFFFLRSLSIFLLYSPRAIVFASLPVPRALALE